MRARLSIAIVIVLSSACKPTVSDVSTNNALEVATKADEPTTSCLWKNQIPAMKCKALIGHILFVSVLQAKDPKLLDGVDSNGDPVPKAGKSDQANPPPPMPPWWGKGPDAETNWKEAWNEFRTVRDFVTDKVFDKMIEMMIEDFPVAMQPYLVIIHNVMSLTGDTMVLPAPSDIQQSIANMHDLNQVNETIAFTQKGIDLINSFTGAIYGGPADALAALSKNMSDLQQQRDYLVHNPGSQTNPNAPTTTTISSESKSPGALKDGSNGIGEGHMTGRDSGARGSEGSRDTFKGSIRAGGD